MSKDSKNPPRSTPVIGLGAALAHGCCSGLRRPPSPVAKPALRLLQLPQQPTDADDLDDSADNLEQSGDSAINLAILAHIRHTRGISQVELAGRLNVSQPHIAQVEQQEDMLLSTLDRHIQALGGNLQLVAHFPEVSFSLKETRGMA